MRHTLLANTVLLVTSTLCAQPDGFRDELVASGLGVPTAFEFAPDRTLFLAVQTGRLLALPSTGGPPETWLELSVHARDEMGLVGLALSPEFDDDRAIYLYYSLPDGRTNRVSRFTLRDPALALGTEEIIIDALPAGFGYHVAGDLEFGPRGDLFISIGDGAQPEEAQNPASLSGKILRLRPDGAVPADNPFVGNAAFRPEIWALGFRNPYRFAIDASGDLLVADVGPRSWEELNLVRAGQNCGWPDVIGPETREGLTAPILAYEPRLGARSCITGTVVYTGAQFPEEYQGDIFTADFVTGEIRRVRRIGEEVIAEVWHQVTADGEFEGIPAGPIELGLGPDGDLWYSNYVGEIRRISYGPVGNRAPRARIAALPVVGTPPLEVSFSGSASEDPDGDLLTYRWDFGDGSPVETEVDVRHTYRNAGVFVASLEVRDPDGRSHRAQVEIEVGRRFLRGDSNGSGFVDLSDPVHTLGHLFAFGFIIPCADAADADDSGVLDISDAIYSLQFQFIGGPAYPPPYPEPGFDPTDDRLGCDS